MRRLIWDDVVPSGGQITITSTKIGAGAEGVNAIRITEIPAVPALSRGRMIVLVLAFLLLLPLLIRRTMV